MKYLVDCFKTYATVIEVDARSRKAAEDRAYEMLKNGEVANGDFEETEDFEVECSGKVDKNGERVYF